MSTYLELQSGRVWCRREGGTLVLGVTDRLIDELGELQSLTLPDEGEALVQGELIVTLEGNAGSFEVLSPEAGNVKRVNKAVQGSLESLSEDPGDSGWLVEIDLES